MDADKKPRVFNVGRPISSFPHHPPSQTHFTHIYLHSCKNKVILSLLPALPALGQVNTCCFLSLGTDCKMSPSASENQTALHSKCRAERSGGNAPVPLRVHSSALLAPPPIGSPWHWSWQQHPLQPRVLDLFSADLVRVTKKGCKTCKLSTVFLYVRSPTQARIKPMKVDPCIICPWNQPSFLRKSHRRLGTNH